MTDNWPPPPRMQTPPLGMLGPVNSLPRRWCLGTLDQTGQPSLQFGLRGTWTDWCTRISWPGRSFPIWRGPMGRTSSCGSKMGRVATHQRLSKATSAGDWGPGGSGPRWFGCPICRTWTPWTSVSGTRLRQRLVPCPKAMWLAWCQPWRLPGTTWAGDTFRTAAKGSGAGWRPLWQLKGEWLIGAVISNHFWAVFIFIFMKFWPTLLGIFSD